MCIDSSSMTSSLARTGSETGVSLVVITMAWQCTGTSALYRERVLQRQTQIACSSVVVQSREAACCVHDDGTWERSGSWLA